MRVQPVAAAVAPQKKKGRLRYYAELVGAGLLALPLVVYLAAKTGSMEAHVDGPYVMVLDGKMPVAWAHSEAVCEIERDVEFPSPKVECVPEAKAPKVPAGGVEVVQASAKEGSTAWRASKYIRYAPGVYSPARCKARAALLSLEGMKGSFGVVSQYSCEKPAR